MDEIELSCSLDDPDLAARRAEWRSLDAVLVESRDAPNGYVALYRGDEATARALEALVAAERECCPDFDWSLDRRDGLVELRVSR